MADSAGRSITFNGINARTGTYLMPPLEASDVARLARGLIVDPAHQQELVQQHRRKTTGHLGVGAGVDPFNLASAGWCVLFADDADPEVREALQPLLRHRASLAGELYREFAGADGHHLDESKNRFLARNLTGPGPVVPRKLPYYVLIVGSPERISYRFQYELDVARAVGRVWFDTADQYSHYARNVVALETAAGRSAAPQVAFFGVRNDDDVATQLSADLLITPLARDFSERYPAAEVTTIVAEQATKRRLTRLLGGTETPQVLFTASHGMGFPRGDPLQQAHQGALLCQDWPGPRQYQGEISPDCYLSADDIPDSADLRGMIAFHFACYGAGTPRFDAFSEPGSVQPEEIAEQAFVSRLAQRLLSHPNGALAVVGHVDRAWGFSFVWDGAVEEREAFQSALSYIVEGKPLGSATEFFGERYSDISTMLTTELEEVRAGAHADDVELADLWIAHNDARNVVILGDPAVHVSRSI
jgi:hypothetical protein